MKLFVQVRVGGGGQIQDNISSFYSFHVFFLLLECNLPLIVVILLFSSCLQLKHCLQDVNLSTDFNCVFELHFETVLTEVEAHCVNFILTNLSSAKFVQYISTYVSGFLRSVNVIVFNFLGAYSQSTSTAAMYILLTVYLSLKGTNVIWGRRHVPTLYVVTIPSFWAPSWPEWSNHFPNVKINRLFFFVGLIYKNVNKNQKYFERYKWHDVCIVTLFLWTS